MDAVIDAFVDLVSAFVDVVINVVSAIWHEVVAPLIEFVFNVLGFEDETIVNGYVATQPMYGNEDFKPFKGAAVNSLFNGTEIVDEIKNLYITGDQIRVKSYKRKADALGIATINTINSVNVDDVAIKAAIDSELTPETVTIITSSINPPNLNSYCNDYLLNNSGTTGHTYTIATRELVRTSDGVKFEVAASSPFVFDVINNTYDINANGSLVFVITIESAVNIATVAISSDSTINTPTEDYVVIGSATNELVVVSNTDGTVGGVVTITTANSLIPPIVAANTVGSSSLSDVITVTSADVTTSPTPDVSTSVLSSTPLVIEDLIPAIVDLSRRYEVSYTLDSDLDPSPAVYYWYHTLAITDAQYPALSVPTPSLPTGDDSYILPVVAIKSDGVFTTDLAGTVDDAEYQDQRGLLRRYGVDIKDITKSFVDDDDPAADINAINDIFFNFGINIADTSAQASLRYLYEFFSSFIIGSTDQDVIDYNSRKTDIALLDLARNEITFQAGFDADEADYYTYDDQILNINDVYAAIGRHDSVFASNKVLYDAYVVDQQLENPQQGCPVFLTGNWQQPCMPLLTYVGERIEDYYKIVKDKNLNVSVNYSVTSGRYNQSVNFGPSTNRLIAGTVFAGAVIGDVTKTINAAGFQLILRRQFDGSNYEELTVNDLTSFTLLSKGSSEVILSALDFVGDDNGGTNLANNFTLPISYGMLNKLGILERKAFLFEAAQISMYSVTITELRYYETRKFGSLLKIVAIVYTVYTWDTEGGSALFAAGKYYVGKLLIEKVIQAIILANPDSELAAALAVVIGVIAGSYLGDIDLGFNADTILLAVQALQPVATTYADIQIEAQEVRAEDLKDRQEELKQLWEEYEDGSNGFLDYIQKIVTMRVEQPEPFYRRTLNDSLTDEMLDLASQLELDRHYQFNAPILLDTKV